MTTVLALVLAGTMLATTPVPALVPPPPRGFTGTWRLDVAGSELGKARKAPRSREDRITEEGAWVAVRSLTVRASGDTLLLDYRYRTDGEATNQVMGQDVRTRGRRDGGALRFESEAQLMLFKFEVSERWSVTPDGARLTMERTSNSPLGKERQRLLFRRSR